MPTLRRLQAKYNIRSGGDWSSRWRDFGHFEWAGPRGAQTALGYAAQ
jgi:hypothetical protein